MTSPLRHGAATHESWALTRAFSSGCFCLRIRRQVGFGRTLAIRMPFDGLNAVFLAEATQPTSPNGLFYSRASFAARRDGRLQDNLPLASLAPHVHGTRMRVHDYACITRTDAARRRAPRGKLHAATFCHFLSWLVLRCRRRVAPSTSSGPRPASAASSVSAKHTSIMGSVCEARVLAWAPASAPASR